MADREAVVRAIHDTPNLAVASRRLGVARKTLYNRMREYDLPAGKSGRPRLSLPQHGDGIGALIGVAALIGVGWLASRWWRQSGSSPAITGTALHGTDVLGSYY
jgi:regulatory Fis family protein